MKLYKPVPITSAEQAEALPVGTVVYADDAAITTEREAASKIDQDLWARSDLWQMHATNAEMIGWTAFVPIEAEEEYTTDEASHRWDVDAIYGSPESVRRDGWTGTLKIRHTTDWRDA